MNLINIHVTNGVACRLTCMKRTKGEKNGPQQPQYPMGMTFWTNPKHPTLASHLHVVISDPRKSATEIAVVNAATVRQGEEFDAACVLNPGDHRGITRASYMVYWRAWVVNANAIKALVDAGQIHTDQPMPADALKRIQDGAMKSAFKGGAPKRVRGLLAEQ